MKKITISDVTLDASKIKTVAFKKGNIMWTEERRGRLLIVQAPVLTIGLDKTMRDVSAEQPNELRRPTRPSRPTPATIAVYGTDIESAVALMLHHDLIDRQDASKYIEDMNASMLNIKVEVAYSQECNMVPKAGVPYDSMNTAQMVFSDSPEDVAFFEHRIKRVEVLRKQVLNSEVIDIPKSTKDLVEGMIKAVISAND